MMGRCGVEPGRFLPRRPLVVGIYVELANWLGEPGGVATEEEHADFSGSSLCDWRFDGDVEAGVPDTLPLQQLPDHFFPSHDLFQDFSSTFCVESIAGDIAGEKDPHLDVASHEVDEITKVAADGGGEREERAITFEEVSRYFYVPITVAAKELKMGLTQLKKKCRELGIPRWPHRKMKSLQALISNVQELGREDGEMGETQLQRAIEILEREREAMERVPGTQLEERTKRLRQACFKANFKKRRRSKAAGGGETWNHVAEV